MNPFVWTVSAVWSSASWLARSAVSQGLLPSERLNSRVISVGNLQVGGTGKTPLVAQIAREASERGLSVCILTRGYKSAWEKTGGVLEPQASPADPSQCGDEPALLQIVAPNAWIAVGKDRKEAFAKAEKRFGASFDLVILDDGFQHWKIKKDLEIIAVSSKRMSERLYRDWPSQLGIADLIVWTKGEELTPAPDRPYVKIRYDLPKPGSNEPSIWVVCGVADPRSFSESLRKAGWSVKREIFREDHSQYKASDVARWMRDADQEGCRVAITGKDWVKWRALGINRSDVLVFEPEIEFQSGEEISGKNTMGIIATLLLWMLSWTLYFLPRRAQLGLGRGIGRILKGRKVRQPVIEQNLSLAFPDKEPAFRDELLERAYDHVGFLLIELFFLFGPIARFIRKYAELEGIENWQAADAQGKGVIFISSHVGNWEVMSGSGGLLGRIDLMIVTKLLKPFWLHRAVEKGRLHARYRGTYEPRTLKDVLRHLSKGGTAGFVMDQYSGPPVGVRVPVFGVPVGTPAAIAMIAKRTGAPVLPVVNHRRADGRFVTEIRPALEWKSCDDPRLEIAENTARFAQVLEADIRLTRSSGFGRTDDLKEIWGLSDRTNGWKAARGVDRQKLDFPASIP